MSETMSKAEKLAAAKRKLRQFQEQQRAVHQPPSSVSPALPSSAVASDAGSSTHRSAASTPDLDALHTLHSNGPIPADPATHPFQAIAAGGDSSALHASLAAAQAAVMLERQQNQAHTAQIQLLHSHIQQQQLQLQQQQQQLAAAQQPQPTAGVDPQTLTTTIEQLRQQLAAHTQTVAVLVAEKSDLAGNLAKFQSLAREKIADVEELQGRLNASRHRVQTLERDLADARQSQSLAEQQLLAVRSEGDDVRQALAGRDQRIADMADEREELRQQLQVRHDECAALGRQLQQLQYEHGLAQLKLSQLSDGETETGAQAVGVETLLREQTDARRQIVELQAQLERLAGERDRAGEQYQTYVQQLTAENGKLSRMVHENGAQAAKMQEREASLVQHMGELERQLQQQLASSRQAAAVAAAAVGGTTTAAEDGPRAEELAALKEANEALSQTIARQTAEIAEHSERAASDAERIAHLETAVERLQHEQPDSKSLLDTMQSDKVTASRAVAQNVQLKQQLEELQRAFVQLSNDKLELTERLQSEQYLGRENKQNAESRLEEVTSIQTKLHFKDEEMIRLSHENEQRHKEVLQLQQEIDRLRHYESKVESSAAELRKCHTTIQRLRQQNAAQTQATVNVEASESCAKADDIEGAEVQLQPSETDSDSMNRATETDDANEQRVVADTDVDEPIVCEHIPTDAAMAKLQERFTRTMSDVAELTEEKNRLEHLCTQLQGETETIGEYIALYQQQRQQLKQRELEKDHQMQLIVRDREEMRDKLMRLNMLVERLIQATKDNDVASVANGSPVPNGIDTNDNEAPSDNGNTAEQILSLLGEIQDKNRNKQFYDEPVPDVHNCACCYGQLEIV